jgi:hypothetical protein
MLQVRRSSGLFNPKYFGGDSHSTSSRCLVKVLPLDWRVVEKSDKTGSVSALDWKYIPPIDFCVRIAHARLRERLAPLAGQRLRLEIPTNFGETVGWVAGLLAPCRASFTVFVGC